MEYFSWSDMALMNCILVIFQPFRGFVSRNTQNFSNLTLTIHPLHANHAIRLYFQRLLHSFIHLEKIYLASKTIAQDYLFPKEFSKESDMQAAVRVLENLITNLKV